MAEKSPADVLEEAADLLLIHGRCREALEDRDGRMCALGALVKATHGEIGVNTPNIPAFSALERHVERPIVCWNNDPATTDDDVRDAMLLAAKSLRNGES